MDIRKPITFDVVVGVLTNPNDSTFYGIGKNNSIPYKSNADMEYFRNLTSFTKFPGHQNMVVMGRRTWESLPPKFKPLPNRINVVLSKTLNQSYFQIKKDNNLFLLTDFDQIFDLYYQLGNVENIFVIGGATIYNLAIHHSNFNRLYLNRINNNYQECDTILNPDFLDKMKLEKKYSLGDVDFCEYTRIKEYHQEYQYLNLLQNILEFGSKRQTRNAITYSTFGSQIEFNVGPNHGFPLLTTKRVFWRGVCEELFLFLKGQTNANILSEKKVRIWDSNTTKEFQERRGLDYQPGDMGPMYGWQFRFYGLEYEGMDKDYSKMGGFDQLREVINRIQNNPMDRRMLMTSYNPAQVKDSVLAPCHSLVIQFYVEGDNSDILSVKMYQRSADMFLGVPFNIASTSLLLYIIAEVTNKTPGRVIISFGDTHIYEQHLEAVKTQLSRTPSHPFPQLKIKRKFNEQNLDRMIDYIESLSMDDLELLNYKCDKPIKAQMIA